MPDGLGLEDALARQELRIRDAGSVLARLGKNTLRLDAQVRRVASHPRLLRLRHMGYGDMQASKVGGLIVMQPLVAETFGDPESGLVGRTGFSCIAQAVAYPRSTQLTLERCTIGRGAATPTAGADYIIDVSHPNGRKHGIEQVRVAVGGEALEAHRRQAPAGQEEGLGDYAIPLLDYLYHVYEPALGIVNAALADLGVEV
ncbi:MAG TPA: hypothetical protein VGG13_04120 [Candidatus Saccharimonadales bacterium]